LTIWIWIDLVILQRKLHPQSYYITSGQSHTNIKNITIIIVLVASVAEPHHFYAALAPDPAPGKNFDDAAPAAPAPAPTLLYSKTNFLK
jgi:hypothetical protein